MFGIVSPAHAQSTVGFQLSGGPLVSAGSTFRLTPELRDGPSVELQPGEPVLLNSRNGPGFHLGAGILLNELLLYYRLERLSWRDDVEACRVSDQAAENRRTALPLPNGTIDDLGVDYHCTRRDRPTRTPIERRAWVAHALGTTLHFYAANVNRPRIYAFSGGALMLTTNHSTEDNRRIRPGFRLKAGGGLDYHFDDNVAFNLEVQYAFTVYGKDGEFTNTSYRAAQAGRTVLSAILEPMHTVSLTVGIRIYLKR